MKAKALSPKEIYCLFCTFETNMDTAKPNAGISRRTDGKWQEGKLNNPTTHGREGQKARHVENHIEQKTARRWSLPPLARYPRPNVSLIQNKTMKPPTSVTPRKQNKLPRPQG